MVEMDREFHGSSSVTIPDEMKYRRQIPYGPADAHISEEARKLRLRASSDLRIINNYLVRFECQVLHTNPGNDSLFEAVRLQLHVPKDYTATMFRHQIASYLVEDAAFFFPRLRSYLNKRKLTFSSYVHGIYNGIIWADEFVLGAIGKMFNIRITVVSPYFSDVWNIFHDGKQQPDIVLIVNGVDFGLLRDEITHVSATRGLENDWKCVGSGQKLNDLGQYVGYTEGRKAGIDLFTINKNRDLLKKTSKMLHDVNQLCRDVKDICMLRDDTIEQLKKIDIDVGDFKRLSSYFTEEELPPVRDSNTIPVLQRRIEIVPSSHRRIPKIALGDYRKTDLGKEFLDEAMKEVYRENEFENIAKVHNRRVETKSRTVCESSTPEEVKRKECETYYTVDLDKKLLNEGTEANAKSSTDWEVNQKDSEIYCNIDLAEELQDKEIVMNAELSTANEDQPEEG